MHSSNQTIVAISTPPGKGGVGMIRLSGSQALRIVEAIFKPAYTASWQTHQLRYGWIVDTDTIIDDVMIAWMQAPNTYTGEEVVEIFAHGNPVVLEQIILLCL